VLHEAAELLPSENELLPLIFDAKVEIFFLICLLPQDGQVTSRLALALRSSSSKGCPHSVHINSKIGMLISV
jgi:hypothetical protein